MVIFKFISYLHETENGNDLSCFKLHSNCLPASKNAGFIELQIVKTCDEPVAKFTILLLEMRAYMIIS